MPWRNRINFITWLAHATLNDKSFNSETMDLPDWIERLFCFLHNSKVKDLKKNYLKYWFKLRFSGRSSSLNLFVHQFITHSPTHKLTHTLTWIPSSQMLNVYITDTLPVYMFVYLSVDILAITSLLWTVCPWLSEILFYFFVLYIRDGQYWRFGIIEWKCQMMMDSIWPGSLCFLR